MPDPVAPGTQIPADRVDPNIVMPPNVAAAAAASDAAYQAAYGPPVAEPPVAPPPVPNGQANGQGELPLQPPELPETNPDGTPNYQNLYKSLRGRWEAEQRRLRETQDQYEQRVRDLARENERLKQPPLPGEGTPPVLVSPQEIQDYGADFLDVVKRAAVEAVLPMMKPLAQNLGQVQARIETAESETGKQFVQRMHANMDSMIPGWKEMNEDPNFIAWTRQSDVFSGLNRQELLQKAWYAGDSNRVAAFFQGFLAEEAAVNPAAAQARQQAMLGAGGHAYAPNGAGPDSPAQPPVSRVTLESLAAPGRARAAGVGAPAGKPVWTAAGISQFYNDVSQGKFRGRDAERIATEQDLMSAQREGRIHVNPRTATTLQGNR